MKSIWRKTVSMPEFPRLRGEHATDVLIIGGGIVGILTAHHLRERGVPYILVEANKLCGGTTGNTTAKLTVGHGLIYSRLQKEAGLETAQAYYEANKLALDKFAQLCKDIDCDYEIRDNYVYSIRDRAALERELAALERLRRDARYCASLPLPIDNVGAVCIPDQAQFNPLKFLAGIAKDLNAYEHTRVCDVEENKARTSTGSIRAKCIVFATHFPFIDRHGGFFLKLYQHRSYVLALKGAEDVGGMYVDECKTGLSFRNYGDLLLLGGGGHRTGKQGGGYEELRRFAEIHYPSARVVAHWAAQDCMSLDGMPYIGAYSKSTTRWLCASGFNKWGMTGAMLASVMLTDRICGRKNEYQGVFMPSRSILKPQLFINTLETASNLLSPFGKRCTHLGCKLKWNAAEHSFDCACHGSRFSKDGDVLNNPANKPYFSFKEKKM